MIKKLIVSGVFLFTLIVGAVTANAYYLIENDFNDGVSAPWFLQTGGNAMANSRVTEGNVKIHIDKGGIDVWDVSFRNKQFVINKNHKYRYSFKVRSDKPMEARMRIGDNDSERNYYEYIFKEIDVNSSWQTVSDEFTADSSYSKVEFDFYVGGKYLLGASKNDIYFDDISLEDVGVPDPTPTKLPERIDIRVNQMGYYPDLAKKATLVSTFKSPVKVILKNSYGQTVWEGMSKPEGADIASGDVVHIIDFSDFKQIGKGYRLYTEDAHSYDFDIGTDIYTKMKYDALKFFYYARSGEKINMPYCVESMWERQALHESDVVLQAINTDFSDGPYTGGPVTIDGTGGWFDAGNFAKNIVGGGLATWMLQNQYEMAIKNKVGEYEDNKMNIPESRNKYPDLLDEARHNMEFMLNAQIPAGYNKEGMVIHRIADEYWGILGSIDVIDPANRYFLPPSTEATLNFAACAAQASRLWKDYDEDFSRKCLKAAEAAWEAAQKYPDVHMPVQREYPGYTDELYVNDKDEFYWAACELFISTGKAAYLDYIRSSPYAFKCPKGSDGGIERASAFNAINTAACGTFSLALTSPKGLGADEIKAAKAGIADVADYYMVIQAQEGYGVPLGVSTYLFDDIGRKIEIKDGYGLYSNLAIINRSIVMAYAYQMTKDRKYLNGMTESMDYIMGRNPLTKSYVSGYGEDPLKNPNNYIFCQQVNPDMPPVPPGFLSSGPNSAAADPWAQSYGLFDNGVPAMRCYLDNAESWSTNITSPELNSSLAWLTAYIDGVYKAAPSIPAALDVNNDGVINLIDVVTVAKAFNSSKGDARYVSEYDFNSDGAINMNDIIIIARYFNTIVKN